MNSTNNEILPKSYKMTELGPLPEEWEVVAFEKCIKKEASKVGKVKQQEYKVYGKYPIIDQGQSLIAGYCDNEKYVYEGRLPVIIFGDHTRILKFINFPFVTGADGTKVLTPNTFVILPEFFYFVLLNIKIPNRGYNRHYSLLREQKLPLPPLPEQQKIAVVLSAVQEAKEKTEAVIDATKALKKSMMKHLFTYGPVSPAETEKVPLKETEIGKVPEEWEVVRLGEVADSFIGGGTPSTDVNEYWFGDIHWTTSKNINSLYLLCGEKKITEKGLRESSTHLIPKYNLIIGTRVGVGKVAINKVDIAISQDLTGVFIDKEKYSLEYLAFLIYTDKVQKYFKECTRGTTIKGIPRDDLKKLPLQIPPLPVQQKIASILSAIDEKIQAEEAKEKALEDLFRSLLSHLMSGKIRVKDLEVGC